MTSFLSKEIDEDEMTPQLLRNTQSFGDKCIYKQIHKVEPGGWLEFDLNDNFIIKSQNNLIPKEWINNNKCLEIFPPNDKVDGMFAVNIQKI